MIDRITRQEKAKQRADFRHSGTGDDDGNQNQKAPRNEQKIGNVRVQKNFHLASTESRIHYTTNRFHWSLRTARPQVVRSIIKQILSLTPSIFFRGQVEGNEGEFVNFKKICVLGLGYIGLPTASTFAAHGVKVLGVDVNPQVIETLRNGGIHIHEPGLRETVQSALASGNFNVSTSLEEADAFLIAVPTPFQENKFGEYNGQKYKLADMRAVTSATEAIVPFLRKGNLVVLESTSPPRTTIELVAPILARSGLQAGRDFHLAYSPERVLPGQILRELIENARVIGGVTPESAQAGADLYSIFVKGQIVQTDATTAEMVKLMENTYRDVNIAIANEFARLADKFGVDVWEAIQIASLHPRVKILSPGPGVGGHCISVDPWFF
ncbi:MAG: nucleotide sugar dehydrogenase, partial [Chloroflexi bacterium]|nr:nucleotide sugar dehydrogenase [Chloroflexota bacterium]